MFSPRSCALATVAAAGLAVPAMAQPIAATLVMKVGDTVGNDGAVVSGVGQPYVNSLNRVGFVVLFSPPTGGRGIWYNGALVFEAHNAPDTPTGSEDTMGVSDTGGWIYSPSVGGLDAVYTNSGLLLRDDDPLPNNPGFFSVFNSRPRMTDNGAAVWIGGYTATQGGTTTHRAMFRNSTPADLNATTIVFGTGDVVGGFTISGGGPGFSYDVAPNGLHFVNPVGLSTGSTTNDSAVVLDATTIIAHEGSPTGAGDNWQNFGGCGVNNSGNWILAGDTSASTATDGFIAYNGTIAVREGDTLAGVVLSGSSPALSIDNNNRVLFSWNPTATETVFLAQAPDIAGTAQVLLAVGNEIDTSGDGVADYTVQDFNGSYGIANAFDLGDSGPVYLNVDLREIGGTTDIEAILALGGEPPCPPDWNDDDVVNSTDISAFLTSWLDSVTNGNLIADFNADTVVNSTDISAFLTAWLDAVQNGC